MRLDDIERMTIAWGPISEAAVFEFRKESSLILVPEGRPYLLGLKYNIPLLKRENINFVYCTDNALGLLFYKGKIKQTLIFYRDKRNDGILSVTGSLYIALLSKLHNVPIKVSCAGGVDFGNLDKNTSTLDGRDFILGETKKDYIIESDLEFIPQEVLQ